MIDSRRVVITGMGMVSPLGNTLKQSWDKLITGQSGIERYVNDPIIKNTIPYNLALIKNFDYKKWKVPHAASRMNSFLASSCQQAINHSNLNIETLNPAKVGICIGCMSSNITKLSQYAQQSVSSFFTNIHRLSMLQILSNIPTATLNVKYKLKGPSLTVSTACASGLSAVVQGYKWIKLGETQTAIVGGVQDVYNSICVNSSIRLQAMSTKIYDAPSQSSRPFDKLRSGFILGEGCGVLILEEYESAKKRNANILAEIAGYGYTSDGYSLVRPQSTGDGQIRAMQNCLQMGNVSVGDVDHFNVHATSTLAGDQIQAKSILTLLNGYSKQKSTITAIKSSIGHTFGAAGAIQLIFGIQTIQNNLIPKILNLKESEIKDLNYAYQNINQKVNIMIKNSFGFGGINVSLLVKKL